MSQPDLIPVVNVVLRRAKNQGYVLPREVRAELSHAGLSDTRWKEVLEQAGTVLKCKHGRYYFGQPATAAAAEDQRRQQRIHDAVQRLIRHCRAANIQGERRGQDRIDFIQSVEVRTENGETLTLLSRDLSLNGICLIAPQSLLGKKITMVLAEDSTAPYGFLARIVWTCAVGSGLYENGGVFLETLPNMQRQFKVVCDD